MKRRSDESVPEDTTRREPGQATQINFLVRQTTWPIDSLDTPLAPWSTIPLCCLLRPDS